MPAADRAPGRTARQAPRRNASRGAGDITAVVLAALAIVLASFIKGSIAFGFPIVATPLLALALDVKTAVAVSIVPNIVMDGVQVVRRGGTLTTVRRLAWLLVFGLVGVVLGTRLLAVMPPQIAMFILGAFVVGFVALNTTGVSVRIPLRWERWLSPPVGLFAGVLGGLTNVPGTPLIVYFYALGMDKQEFVRSVALAFMTIKLFQLGATAWYGLLTPGLLLASLGLTVIGLAGFAAGLRVQDYLPEKIFNRAVMVFLALLGVSLIVRAF